MATARTQLNLDEFSKLNSYYQELSPKVVLVLETMDLVRYERTIWFNDFVDYLHNIQVDIQITTSRIEFHEANGEDMSIYSEALGKFSDRVSLIRLQGHDIQNGCDEVSAKLMQLNAELHQRMVSIERHHGEYAMGEILAQDYKRALELDHAHFDDMIANVSDLLTTMMMHCAKAYAARNQLHILNQQPMPF